jgi:hypothetical protein
VSTTAAEVIPDLDIHGQRVSVAGAAAHHIATRQHHLVEIARWVIEQHESGLNPPNDFAGAGTGQSGRHREHWAGRSGHAASA